MLSLWQALRWSLDRILLPSVSGAVALHLMRLFSCARFLTNIDKIEWKRDRWNGLARIVLHISKWAAVRLSHEVIADNRTMTIKCTPRILQPKPRERSLRQP